MFKFDLTIDCIKRVRRRLFGLTGVQGPAQVRDRCLSSAISTPPCRALYLQIAPRELAVSRTMTLRGVPFFLKGRNVPDCSTVTLFVLFNDISG